MLDITKKRDDEWNDILKDFGIKIDYPIKKTGNFKEGYLNSNKN